MRSLEDKFARFARKFYAEEKYQLDHVEFPFHYEWTDGDSTYSIEMERESFPLRLNTDGNFGFAEQISVTVEVSEDTSRYLIEGYESCIYEDYYFLYDGITWRLVKLFVKAY
ncbi:MAG: hypothetical protein OEM52_06265 [bacterium]|nr:hypothetical protein [bacterium]